MHITAIIPARYASTRLPGKPLIKISGKTLIQHVFEAVVNTNLFHRIIIATDNIDIYNHAIKINAETIMTSERHLSGTDRIEEAARNINTDLIINVQGDEPFITKEPLINLIEVFKDNNITTASLMTFGNKNEINNPNIVKVVCDNNSNALYFSRSVIPFNRDSVDEAVFYRHIGVYAYRPEILKMFVKLPTGKLENLEKLEQLRLLENGYKIRMVLTDYKGIGIDTPEDLLQFTP